MHTSNILNRPKLSCTFKTFWAGFTDWWAERSRFGAVSSSDKPEKSTTNRVIQVGLLAGLLVAAPVFAMLFAPMAAGAMSAAGARAVGFIAQAGSVVVGLGFFLGLPIWAGIRTLRFSRAMCERGQDILDGRRARVRLL